MKVAAYRPAKDLVDVVNAPDASPVAICSAMDDATQRSWRDWLPETLTGYLKTELSPLARDRLMAAQVAVSNPDVFEDWPLFVAVNAPFNRRIASFEWMDKPALHEAAWTCVALQRIARREFGEDMLRFISAMCYEEGVVWFPWGRPGGLLIAELPWMRGMMDESASELGHHVQTLWEQGAQDAEPSAVSETNPLHVQLQRLTACAGYIRSQPSDVPGDYPLKATS